MEWLLFFQIVALMFFAAFLAMAVIEGVKAKK